MSHAGDGSGAAYSRPGPAQPLRIAFVGHRVFACACPPEGLVGDSRARIESRLLVVEPGSGADSLVDQLRALRPHAVVVFDPECLPAGALADVQAATLGFACGSLPRIAGEGTGADAVIAQLRGLDRARDYDRLVSCDPRAAEAVGGDRVWRSLPLPVTDACFAAVQPIRGRPRSMFVGRATEHRERMLLPSKHRHDLLHVVFGVYGPELVELLREHDVGVHVHAAPGFGFSSRVVMHLAAGHLVLSEPLGPEHGLEANIDYLAIGSAGALDETLERLERFPDMYSRIRIRGHLKAEQYRASHVFARLIGDLFADVAAFGTRRA